MGKKRDEIGQQVRQRVEVAKIRAKAAREIAVVAAPLLGSPSLAPVVTSPKVGEFTEKAVMWAAEFGPASTGAWIKGLKGAARTDSTLARLGLGTLANGGWGRAGGLKVVAAAGTGASAVVFGVWLMNGAIAMHSKLKDDAERARAAVALCSECQGVLPIGESDEKSASCPHCGHVVSQPEQE